MKVQCPECKANYNLDVSRIPAAPEKGITVTCPKCKNKFPLKIKPQEKKKEESPDTQDVLIPCPACGHVNISTKKCMSCGRAFSDEEMDRLKITLNS